MLVEYCATMIGAVAMISAGSFMILSSPLALVQQCRQITVEINLRAVLRGDETEKVSLGARGNRDRCEPFAPGVDWRQLLDQVIGATNQFCRKCCGRMAGENRDRFVRLNTAAGKISRRRGNCVLEQIGLPLVQCDVVRNSAHPAAGW